MKTLNKCLLGFLFLMAPKGLMAQQAEMADGMRAEGKIYVVVAVILTVLAGFLIYLFIQDRKLSKIEKLLQKKENQIKR